MDALELQRRFGEVVRRLRLERRVGQEALAHKAGLHRTHLSTLERGRQMPSLDVVRKLAEALGLTMSGLLAEVESGDGGEPQAELPRGRPPKRGGQGMEGNPDGEPATGPATGN